MICDSIAIHVNDNIARSSSAYSGVACQSAVIDRGASKKKTVRC